MSFYSSNQAKLKKYTGDRRVEEVNGNKHQALVYADIAQQNSSIAEADRLAKLGMDIVGKIAKTPIGITKIIKATDTEPATQQTIVKPVIEHIAIIIESGSLSQWWDSIKKIPNKGLSKKAKLVLSDIKHSESLKTALNDTLTKSIADGASAKEMAATLIQLITGGDEQVMGQLDAAASEGKPKEPKAAASQVYIYSQINEMKAAEIDPLFKEHGTERFAKLQEAKSIINSTSSKDVRRAALMDIYRTESGKSVFDDTTIAGITNSASKKALYKYYLAMQNQLMKGSETRNTPVAEPISS